MRAVGKNSKKLSRYTTSEEMWLNGRINYVIKKMDQIAAPWDYSISTYQIISYKTMQFDRISFALVIH